MEQSPDPPSVYFPASQFEQLEAPSALKVPARQGVHDPAPSSEAYLPAEQGVHSSTVTSKVYFPAVQDVQLEAELPENEPGWQGEQTAAPGEL